MVTFMLFLNSNPSNPVDSWPRAAGPEFKTLFPGASRWEPEKKDDQKTDFHEAGLLYTIIWIYSKEYRYWIMVT